MNEGVFTHAPSPALTDAPRTSFFRSTALLRHFSLARRTFTLSFSSFYFTGFTGLTSLTNIQDHRYC